MKKGTYLANVAPFVEWMSKHLDDPVFAHTYENRRNGKTISFASLFDAYDNFDWGHPAISRLSVPAGRDFSSNSAALNALQQDLKPIAKRSDAAARQGAVDVMRWGGVTSGNVRWLNANEAGLVNLLDQTCVALNAGDTAHPTLTSSSLRFNAGMTKVYSLICNDFIIYDSRVAAALGWAVVKYSKNSAGIPNDLLFPWLPAKESTTAKLPKNRDPSNGNLVFPNLRTPAQHAEWNLKASWLLKAVLKHPNAAASDFNTAGTSATPLRRLEAALFMIGYDLPTSSTKTRPTPSSSSPVSPAAAHSTSLTNWIDCLTLSHRKPFSYRFTTTAIETQNGPRFDDTTVNGTLDWLWQHFQNSPFPLQNSTTKVHAGTAATGLGTAYFAQNRNNPPDTSKLAAILEDMEVLLPDPTVKTKGMHWQLNVALLGLDSAGATVSIRRIIEELISRESEN